MPRPQSKSELIEAIDREYSQLHTLIANMSASQMTEDGLVGTWSAKDVLAHLTEWQQMALGWYRAGLKNQMPQLPAPGYKWRQTPELNDAIYQKHRTRSLKAVRDGFYKSHAEIVQVIQALPNETLFGRNQYEWTGNNTLGTYFVSATSSHYLWARNEIKKGLRARSQKKGE